MKKAGRTKVYQIMGVIGMLLWAGTVFLRPTTVNHWPAANFILGIMPNFGVVFGMNSLGLEFGPRIFGPKVEKLLAPKIRYSLIFFFLFFSEIVHHFFLAAPFDIWDMAASLLAVGILLLLDWQLEN